VIPKVNRAEDMQFVTDVVRHVLPHRHPSHASGADDQQDGLRPLRLIALIESAQAIVNLPSICQASPYLSGLIFAAEDFALDLSLTRTPSLTEFLYARSAIVTAARAYSLPSAIDLVCTAYKGDAGLQTLESECLDGKGLGFNGKQLIHPSQVEVCQQAFSPSEKEIEWAVRITVADQKASQQGRGAWTLDGKMIDAPVAGKAKAIVDKARLCGVDVAEVEKKWNHQEPE
jgi:citrate lyase subunit beta-like protein